MFEGLRSIFNKNKDIPELEEPLEVPSIKILDNPVEKKATLGTSTALGSFFQFGLTGAETPANALSLYEKSTAVSIPVNKIKGPFSSIQPILATDKNEIITDHPVLDLLRKPSPLFDQNLFLETLAAHYLITNEIQLIALGNVNRPPLELQPISPADITVTEGKGGLAQSMTVSGNTLSGEYKLELKGNRARYFNGNLRELRQIRGFSTKNSSLLRGQSLLVSASAEARQHILGNTHNISLLEKGGRLSYVVHYEGDVDLDDFNATKEQVRKEFGGAANAGQIYVSAGGKLRVEEMGTNNKDMDYVKLQQVAINSISLQYGVPLPLVSNQANTFNNYKVAVLALFDDAVLPLADRVYGGLGAFLLPRYGLDPAKFRLTYDILAISALRSRVLEEIKTRKDINIESDNELRTLLAREGYDGGDVILKPANLIPAGTDNFTDDDPPTVTREVPEDE